jgi:phosphoribosyl-dephospho-CoA transferase
VAADIERAGDFPLLTRGLLVPADTAPLHNFLHRLAELHVPARVYGSYGWQQLTGLPCVRDSSDLDLLIAVPDMDTAGQVVWLLRGLQLVCRVDGELLFPNGQAVAWREFGQLIGGKVEHVLVKHRRGVHMAGMAHLLAVPC